MLTQNKEKNKEKKFDGHFETINEFIDAFSNI